MTGQHRALLERVDAFLAEHYRGPGVDELRADITRALRAEPAPPRFGVTARASADTLRALLTSVARGDMTVEDAARLIETWPAPKGEQ